MNRFLPGNFARQGADGQFGILQREFVRVHQFQRHLAAFDQINRRSHAGSTRKAASPSRNLPSST